MAEKQGGITPNEFTTILAELLAARTREESAAGTRRSIMGRFEKMGAHKPGLQLFLKLRNMEPADAELMLTTALRYCRWAQMEIGDQATLFPASDDAGAPSAKASTGLAEATAFEEGFKAGKAGRSGTDHRYHAGTPMAQRFYEGWCDGQATLAESMGVERPTDGTTLRKKVKGKDGEGAEQREAAPSGGRRRGRGRGGAALDAGREHLGG